MLDPHVFLQLSLNRANLRLIVTLCRRQLTLELHGLVHGAFQLCDQIDVFILQLLILLLHGLRFSQVDLQLIDSGRFQGEIVLELLYL